MPEHKTAGTPMALPGLKATAVSAGLFCEFNSLSPVDRLGQTSLVILLLKGNVTLLTHT